MEYPQVAYRWLSQVQTQLTPTPASQEAWWTQRTLPWRTALITTTSHSTSFNLNHEKMKSNLVLGGFVDDDPGPWDWVGILERVNLLPGRFYSCLFGFWLVGSTQWALLHRLLVVKDTSLLIFLFGRWFAFISFLCLFSLFFLHKLENFIDFFLY